VTYTYGGKQGTSRATTARELLPLIEALDGRNVTPDKVTAYPGYPLVTSAESASALFYVFLPALAIAGWWFNQRAPVVAEAPASQRDPRFPQLQAYLPRIRRVALVGGAGLVLLQVVPYGRDHVNLSIGAPSAAAAATCQTVFPPGDESAMRLSDFKARVVSQIGSLNGVLAGLAANNQAATRAQYAQFSNAYRGVAKELAELYPGRCPRLNADAAGADAAIIGGTVTASASASQLVYALNVGLFSLAQDLDIRIRQAGPDQLVGLENPETDRPSVTGSPGWDTARTQALAARACGACHSNQPGLPWYTNVAPLAWLVQYQVDAGRAALNFSEWDRPQGPAVAQVAATAQRGSMPPGWMSLLDPRLQLNEAERAELVRGLQTTLNLPSS
jgi:mono/diheme cytochrome c family protein